MSFSKTFIMARIHVEHVHETHMTENCQMIYITKTYLYKFDPLKLHFYIVKLGFTGVYIITLFFLFH